MQGEVGIGFVGYGWIARAHAHALHTINHLAPLPLRIRPVAIAGRRLDRAVLLARELGFERGCTIEELLDDAEVDVVAVVGATAVHASASIAALERGKPVLCEKPLAGDALQARAMLEAAERAGVTHACGFNYRFVPAVRLARELVDEGRLGALRHFRAVYLQDRAAALRRSPSEMGAASEYAHLVDLLRYLAGEPLDVSAATVSFLGEREDGYAAALRLPAGALASLEASRFATGWKGRQRIELNGTDGSAVWDMEDLNRLRVFLSEDEQAGLGGFRDILVTEPEHPFLSHWWTPGHGLGWDASFVHQWRAFLAAVLERAPVGPHQADFGDGYRAAVVTDAVLRSADEGTRVELAPAAP